MYSICHLREAVNRIEDFLLNPLFNSRAMAPPGVCQSIMNKRSKKNGFGSLANPEMFLNQDFQQLKKYCIERQLRYIDDMFPPNQNSIGQVSLSHSQLARVEWLRPGVCVFLFVCCNKDSERNGKQSWPYIYICKCVFAYLGHSLENNSI